MKTVPSSRFMLRLAVVAVLLFALLVAAVLTRPQTADVDGLASQAAATAHEAAKAPSQEQASELRVTLQKRLGSDLRLRLLDAQGAVTAGGAPIAGERETAVARVGRPQVSAVSYVELSGALERSSRARDAVVLVCGLGLLVAALALAVAGFRRRPERNTGLPSAAAVQRPVVDGWERAPGAPVAASLEQRRAGEERLDLLRAMIRIIDASDEARVVQRAQAALAHAGVKPIEPAPGERFDVDSQSVTAVVETPDAQLHDSVFALVRAGYRDGDRIVRPAEVQIYGATARPPSGAPR
jgi:GrpE